MRTEQRHDTCDWKNERQQRNQRKSKHQQRDHVRRGDLVETGGYEAHQPGDHDRAQHVGDVHLNARFPDPLTPSWKYLREVKEQQRTDAERGHDDDRGQRGQLGWVGQTAQPPIGRNAEHHEVCQREGEENPRADIGGTAQPGRDTDDEIQDRRAALRDPVNRGEAWCGNGREIHRSLQPGRMDGWQFSWSISSVTDKQFFRRKSSPPQRRGPDPRRIRRRCPR